MVESPAEHVKQTILEYLYLKGGTANNLADTLGLPLEEVERRLKLNGTQIRALYLRGNSKRAVARILGISYYEVNKQLQIAGLD